MIFHEPTKTIVYAPGAVLPEGVAYEERSGYKLVRATYGNLVALAAWGLPVPSPLLSYDWPCRPGEEAMETQKLVAAHMVLHPRSYVFSDMRTGKTRAALWACDWIMSRAKERVRALVVSDIEALTKAWASEIRSSFLGRRTWAVVHGTARQRERALNEDVDFYLINHDGLRGGYAWPPRPGEKREARLARCTGVAGALLARNDCKLAVFDEAASYRERTTINWHAASDLVARRSAYAWALTGTPTPNGPIDAYGIKRLIDFDYPESFQSWKERCTAPKGPFKRVPRPGAEEMVDELLSPAVRISRDQCFEESPLEVSTVRAPLSERQKHFMKKLQEQLMMMLDSGAEIPAVNQAALRAKLIQIACGAVYDDNHDVHPVDAAPRLDAFTKILAGTPGKIIVFSPLTSIVHMLQKHIGPEHCLMVSRAMQSDKDRRAVVSAFIQGPEKVLVSHPAPISRGLDLTCAATIVWYAPVDRTEYYLQANQRINGPRQKAVRRIIRLSGSPVEDEIYEKLERNEHLQGAILKLKEMRL